MSAAEMCGSQEALRILAEADARIANDPVAQAKREECRLFDARLKASFANAEREEAQAAASTRRDEKDAMVDLGLLGLVGALTLLKQVS